MPEEMAQWGAVCSIVIRLNSGDWSKQGAELKREYMCALKMTQKRLLFVSV